MGILSATSHHEHHKEKNHIHMNFHIHFQHQNHEKKEVMKDIPKGCFAVLVGQGGEQQRFVIPVIYINHPLFIKLLKVAEEEYDFHQKGPITIPCHVEQFRTVQAIIDKENSIHRHQHHYDHHHAWCFKA